MSKPSQPTSVSTWEADSVPVWDLTPIFPGLESSEFRQAQQRLEVMYENLSVLFDENDIDAGEAVSFSDSVSALFDCIVVLLSEALELERLISLYLAALSWADGSDLAASAQQANFRRIALKVMNCKDRFQGWVARLDTGALIEANDIARDHIYWLSNAVTHARHSLSRHDADILGELPSGQHAWRRLYEDLVAQLNAVVADEAVPMPVLRSRMSTADPVAREELYRAAEDAWATLTTPAAACLNAIKGETLVLTRRAGWLSPLDESLARAGISRRVLDLLHESVAAAIPHVHRFIRAKAQLLGHARALPWWEITAPVVSKETLSWSQCVDLTLAAFARYSIPLARHARLLVDSQWIDAQVRPHKRMTSLCVSLRGAETRVLVNFDGSYDSVLSLGHEFGHSYHYSLLSVRSELLRRAPLPLAETASILCESLIARHIEESAAPDAILPTLNADLIGVTQVLLDAYSRYVFEDRIIRELGRSTVSSSAISEIWADAISAIYGEAVPGNTLPKHYWIAHPHLYNGNFNSWPYYFGLMFGVGALEAHEYDSARFDSFLSSTGMDAPTRLARLLDVDIESPRFWASAVEAVGRRVDRFERHVLAKRATG